MARVYARIVASRVRSQLAYPGSFVLDVVAQLAGQATELVAILVVFTQVDSLGGFRAGEVVLIYGLSATAFGLAGCGVQGSGWRCRGSGSPGRWLCR